jgi:hypothetical protein
MTQIAYVFSPESYVFEIVNTVGIQDSMRVLLILSGDSLE